MWHHKNNLSADANGVLWRKRSSAVLTGTKTIAGTKTWKRTIILGLSCLPNWRSFRPESHLSPIEPAVLLVGYGR